LGDKNSIAFRTHLVSKYSYSKATKPYLGLNLFR
jgi:hypothetical protein